MPTASTHIPANSRRIASFALVVSLALACGVWRSACGPAAAAAEGSQTSDQSQGVASGPSLMQAHAHNDYYHKRPLFDALERGFCSVEADVYLRDGKLLVAHSTFEIIAGRTLESLYLEPLRERIRANNGKVFADGTGLWLLVDIKTNGAAAYAALHALLEQYADVVSETRSGEFVRRPVTVVVSGDRPLEMMRGQAVRYAGIDGRPGDLDSDEPVEQMPWISTDWKSHFRWRGVGAMPPDEAESLRDLAARAHAKQRLLRFWGAPDKVEVWQELQEAGVDLIGADDLDALRRFLQPPPE